MTTTSIERGKALPNLKPILIINCSDDKKPSADNAFDLYKGGIFKMLKSNLGNYREFFEEVLILSAEHGLISGSSHIEHYNTEMPKRTDKKAIAEYATKHMKKTKALIRSFADKNRDIYVCLTNNYRAAFDRMVGEDRKVLQDYRQFYVSDGHRGIGDLRGRLARVINVAKGITPELKPIFQRSGIANEAELGFAAAGCHIGGSLAHANTEHNTTLLATLLDAANHTKLFYDNGLITLLKQGLEIDSTWVFSEYRKIVDTLNPVQRSNFSIVIPDDVFSNEKAQHIVRVHKADILYLADKCRTILPVHKSECIRTHATAMMHELENHPNIALGVPCLTKKKANFMLSTSDIDALLSLKVQCKKAGYRPMFKSVHYFGLSDVTAKTKLAPRLALSQLHNVETTLDCTRTCAVFGKTTKGYRQGTVIENAIRDEHAKPQVLQSSQFKAYGAYQEYHQPNSEPVMTDRLYAMLNEDEIFDFIRIFNDQIMVKHFALQMPEFEEHEADDAIQMAWDITSQRTVSNLIIAWCKENNWNYFRKDNDEVNELEYGVYRFNAIKQLFSNDDIKAVPIQFQLKLSQAA